MIREYLASLVKPSNVFGKSYVSQDEQTGKITVTNWAKNQSFNPTCILSPETLEELVACIKNRNGMKVKAVGALHSWSRGTTTDGVLVSMKKLNKVLSVDTEKFLVKAQAGILLVDLYERMKKHKLALSTMPNVNVITLGGALSNSTHGTNISQGTLAEYVEEIEIVTASGQLLCLRRSSTDPTESRLFDAVLISYGAIGVIYSITLKCVPEYNMILYQDYWSAEDYASNVVQLSNSMTCCQGFMLPSANRVIIKTQTRIPVIGNDTLTIRDRVTVPLWKNLLLVVAHVVTSHVSSKWIRKVNFVKAAVTSSPYINIASWDQAEQHPASGTFINMEYAMPERTIEDSIKFVLRTINYYEQQYGLFREMPIVIRPVGCDTRGYMSSSNRPDKQPTYYLDMPYSANISDLEIQFYKDIEEGLLQREGRVSMSRLFWNHSPSAFRNYPDFDKFLQVKKELDPENVFGNDFTDKLFGYAK